jgi:hypothetical protein
MISSAGPVAYQLIHERVIDDAYHRDALVREADRGADHREAMNLAGQLLLCSTTRNPRQLTKFVVPSIGLPMLAQHSYS